MLRCLHARREGQAHRVGSYAKLDKQKVLFDYPNPAYFVYDDPWLITADVSNLVGKVYNLCRVYIYSNSRFHGHGQLEWLLLSCVEFVLKNSFKEEIESCIKSTKGTDESGECFGYMDRRKGKNGLPHPCGFKTKLV
jgi:hypothetical protein